MAKRLSGNQATDARYLRDYLSSFLACVRDGDASAAEDYMNEMTGVMCVMIERLSDASE